MSSQSEFNSQVAARPSRVPSMMVLIDNRCCKMKLSRMRLTLRSGAAQAFFEQPQRLYLISTLPQVYESSSHRYGRSLATFDAQRQLKKIQTNPGNSLSDRSNPHQSARVELYRASLLDAVLCISQCYMACWQLTTKQQLSGTRLESNSSHQSLVT